MLGRYSVPCEPPRNVFDGKYRYLGDLKSLGSCRPTSPRAPVDTELSFSPLFLDSWSHELAGHLDASFRAYILDGLANGFRIGFDYARATCKPSRSNMASATANVDVINQYLEQECKAGRLAGPMQSQVDRFQVIPLGVILKAHQPGKWRLIVDLSSPQSASVNGGIDRDACSLSYTRVDDDAQRILDLGKGSLLAKLDIQSAYRHIPVHPSDSQLLGIRWQGEEYLDRALPFGLRSVPKIFSAVVDALIWIMFNRGVSHGVHYFDDFLFFGRPHAEECAGNLALALNTCRVLGVPVAMSSWRAINKVAVPGLVNGHCT